MVLLLFRLLLLAIGMGFVESGLLDGLARGSALAWLMVGAGFVLVLAGSAGLIGPLLGGPREEGPP